LGLDGDEVSASNDWLRYCSLVEKIRGFIALISKPNIEVAEAERCLSELKNELGSPISAASSFAASTSSVSSNTPGTTIITPAMHRIASKSARPQSNDPASVVAASMFRDYPVTLLSAACSCERGERPGDPSLELFLSLHGRLIVHLLEVGADPNELGMTCLRSYAHQKQPCLPIDLLNSPTLVRLMIDTCHARGIRLDMTRSQILSHIAGGNYGPLCNLDFFLKILGLGSYPVHALCTARQVAHQVTFTLKSNQSHMAMTGQYINPDQTKVVEFNEAIMQYLDNAIYLAGGL
jgi:hypothetical protein